VRINEPECSESLYCGYLRERKSDAAVAPMGTGNKIMVKNKSKLQLQNFVWRLY